MMNQINQSAIYKFCKELGCCDICCLRYLGIRNSNAIENAKQYCVKFQETSAAADTSESTPTLQETTTNANGTKKPDATNGKESCNGSESPPAKRRKTDICISCLGLLQEDGWPDCNRMVREVLDKKNYDSANFACALSSPIAAILREKAVTLRLEEAFPSYDSNYITPLKEAWKWSYGTQLATFLKMVLDSGAVSPLLITLNMEYPDDLQELEILKTLSPDLFASRSKQRRRFTVEFTRRSVEQALEGVTLRAMRELSGWDNIPRVDSKVSCVSVACAMAPLYLGGRYIKLTRTLPQTPWMVGGKRMMESSVQEIIFEPLAKIYEMSEADADHRLKFMSAGREDVDVRCLGDGRPFAVEITDPRRVLTEAELKDICDKVSAGGQVALTKLVPVTKEELSQLKTGEETKCKTYEALCVKLTHSKDEQDTLNGDASVTVTDADIQKINSFRNTPPGDEAVVLITQKTPIRVLHRRPLLSRQRLIFEMHAEKIPDHPQLFALRIRTSAGAYVKEFIHGELRRTTPSLGAALAANVDILALDVTSVHLDWPDK